jgi:formylglycine-generating enzyme required for sulfatase activity
MRTLKIVLILMAVLLMAGGSAQANNIAVSNVLLSTQDTGLDTIQVQFDITWENSWRDATNYDAAWVFIKYSINAGTTWSHAILKTSGTNPVNFVQGSGTGLDIVVPTDKYGAFLQRTATATGTVSTTGIKFVWDYAASSVSDNDAVGALVRVMAIEMVYVPTLTFPLGSTLGTETNTFYRANTTTTSYSVTAETAITVGSTIGNLRYANPAGGDLGTPVPAAFPKGYNNFYIMKYEISQGQYRDFLNLLTRTQQNTRTASQVASQYVMSNTAGVTNRNGIRAPASIPGGAITFGCDLNNNGTFNEAADGEWIACNFLSWMDVAAYSDWAALRPLSETAYEKACRGGAAVSGEYAWASATAPTQATSITNSGQNTEVAGQTGNGLCNSAGSLTGPLRCGFAGTAITTTRAQLSQGLYGAMDLSGNLQEPYVTVGNATGRAFTGTNGDGALSTNGNAQNSDWPGYAAGEVTGATGIGARGGSWALANTYARVSDRTNAIDGVSTRVNDRGGRLGRTP